MTGAHHSLILNVIHDPSPYAAVVSAVPPVPQLGAGHTTAHRRHLAAAIFGKIGLSAEPKSDAAQLCGCVGATAAGSRAGKHVRRSCPFPPLPGNAADPPRPRDAIELLIR